jgi:hypothetical protein
MDFTVTNHFTLFTLQPHTPAAKAWVKDHLPEDIVVFGDSIAVEHRYIWDVVDDITANGLTVSGEKGN